jgi:hypothetical protein
MVTLSIPALPWFRFTFSQASSRLLRLYTLSISECTFLFFLCLISNARENYLSTVSSTLMLGLSHTELSNFPMPTHCLEVTPVLNKVGGLPPSDAPFEYTSDAE